MSTLPPDIAARRHANSLQPICRLPTELILQIFFHFSSESARDSYEWIWILHVCHMWYMIGVNDPTLWTTVTKLGGVECTTEVLRRSQGLPLDIYLSSRACESEDEDDEDEDEGEDEEEEDESGDDVIEDDVIEDDVIEDDESDERHMAVYCYDPDDEDEEFGFRWPSIDKLLAAIPRARSVTCSRGTLWSHIRQCRTTTLEELELSLRTWNTPEPPTYPIALSDMFSGVLMTLRTLSLTCDYHLDGRLFAPNLQHLRIEIMSFMYGSYYFIDVPSLMESMRQMPRLKKVTLVHVLPDGAGDLYPKGHVLDLPPSLQSFNVDDSAVAVAHLLDLITIPTNTRLDITARVGSLSDISFMASPLKQKFMRRLPDGRFEDLVLRTLLVQEEVDYDTNWQRINVHVDGFTHLSPCLCHVHKYPVHYELPNLSLRIIGYCVCDSPSEYIEELVALFKALPLSDVGTLGAEQESEIFPLPEAASTQHWISSAGAVRHIEESSSTVVPLELARLREVFPNVKSLCLRC